MTRPRGAGSHLPDILLKLTGEVSALNANVKTLLEERKNATEDRRRQYELVEQVGRRVAEAEHNARETRAAVDRLQPIVDTLERQYQRAIGRSQFARMLTHLVPGSVGGAIGAAAAWVARKLGIMG